MDDPVSIPAAPLTTSMFSERPPWGWDYVFVFQAPKFRVGKVRQTGLSRVRSLNTTSETHRDIDVSESEDVDSDSGSCDSYEDDQVVFDACECIDTDDTDASIAKANETRLAVLARVRGAGFQCSQIYVPTENAVFLRIAMRNSVMMRKAEHIGMELKMKSEFGGGYLAFTVEKKSSFENAKFLNAGRNRGSYFCSSDRIMIILATLQSKEEWGCGLNIEKLTYKKDIMQAFAVHSIPEQDVLEREAVWHRWWDPTWNPPFNKMKAYLGARIAIYFVFVSFYAQYLLSVAVLSIPAYLVYRLLRDNFIIAILRWVFGLSLVLWTTMFLENWKRRNALINVKWGLSDYHEDTNDETRPQFKGDIRNGFYCKGGFVPLDDLVPTRDDDDTECTLGSSEELRSLAELPKNPYQDPVSTRNAVLFSAVISVVSVGVVGTCVFLILFFRSEIVTYFQLRTTAILGNASPGILNGLLIFISDAIWQSVSLALTRRENHRTNQSFENSLVMKRFSFQFISNYSSLFYIAFIKPRGSCRLGHIEPLVPDCMVELESQMTSLVITKATVQQVVEIGMPFITASVRQFLARRKTVKPDEAGAASPSSTASLGHGDDSVEVESNLMFASTGNNRYVAESKLMAYESTMSDYSELVLQFGYLCLFGLAFPCAALVSLINNLIEVRTDAYKVLKLSQRPNADDAADIGAWYNILQFLGYLSVLTNAGLLIFTSRSLVFIFESVDPFVKVVAFFVTEHVLFILKGSAAALIKDIPGSTHRILARQQYDLARYFDVDWQNAFRGSSLLKVSEDHVETSRRNLNVFGRLSHSRRPSTSGRISETREHIA